MLLHMSNQDMNFSIIYTKVKMDRPGIPYTPIKVVFESKCDLVMLWSFFPFGFLKEESEMLLIKCNIKNQPIRAFLLKDNMGFYGPDTFSSSL